MPKKGSKASIQKLALNADVVKLYNAGASLRVIAKFYGVSFQAIHAYLDKKGIQLRQNGERATAPRGIRLYAEERYILGELSKKFDEPDSHVIRRAIKDLGAANKVEPFAGGAA